ncbi:MAG: Gfo/Idh/MocA family oxidoreductase [Thermomicrobiales bacterium]|nr:Gfo/Idh/MocA family oxidoreductase [Thermomicrobiales bacterium]
MNLAGYEVSDTIELPEKHDYGIGIIGCGGIVNYAHLPAYRSRGLNVVACYDQDPDAARRTADEHGIPHVATSVDELLNRDDIAILDVAVTPWAQMEIAERAIAAGKHLLCQKPFSDSIESAERVVELAAEAGIKIAVNQQMRWDAGIRVAKQLVEQGAIGTPADARIEVSVKTPWHMWPWIAAQDHLEVMFHSIHYHDALRYLFGDPSSVTAFHHKWPNQPEVGETRTLTVFEYDQRDLQTIIDCNHHNWSDDFYARFRFLGDGGIITGTLGVLYDYPTGRVDTLEYQPNHEPRAWHKAELSTWWIPDAFVGPMASLMEAIQTGGEPITAARDNLGTLRTCFAAYESATQKRTVTIPRPEVP